LMPRSFAGEIAPYRALDIGTKRNANAMCGLRGPPGD
jgi:hypothetical protein